MDYSFTPSVFGKENDITHRPALLKGKSILAKVVYFNLIMPLADA
jgi:hypothetical protein